MYRLNCLFVLRLESGIMQLTVVIPALNEETNIGPLLRLLRAMPEVDEIVVCDGGSHDATVRTAREGGAIVVPAARNRGAQLNAGAREARGDILWFLHADARPHRGSAQLMKRELRAHRVWGGNFRLRFDDARRAARLFEVAARLQRRCGVYYGDSGVWLRRAVFEALGGFRPWPLFEDYDFVRRLERGARRSGAQTLCLPLPLLVSARRFRGGAPRLLLRWAALQLLFSLGVPPQRLAAWYHR